MISIHLDDFVTNALVFSVCWWIVFKGIESAIRVWLFLKTKKVIDKSKEQS